MSYQATNAVLKHSRARGAARMVLFVIASHADAEGRGARLSFDTIALEANITYRAVQYAVSELEKELGEIAIIEKGNGKGHASVYDLSTFVSKGARRSSFTSSNPTAKGEQSSSLATERTKNPALKDEDCSSKDEIRSDAKDEQISSQPCTKELTNSSSTQPSPTAQVEPGADAPRRTGKAKKESALSKLPEDEQAIIEEWRRTTGYYPRESVWPFIIHRLKPDFDAERLRRCGGAYLAHEGMGQKFVAGICDWYRENRTEPRAGDRSLPQRAGNVERSMAAVKSYIAKKQGGQ